MHYGKNKKYNMREFIKILENNGYTLFSTKGDHGKWKKENSTIIILMGGHSINKMLCRRLIKEYDLKIDK